MPPLDYEEQENAADVLDKMKDPIFVVHPKMLETLREENVPFIEMLRVKKVPVICSDVFVSTYDWFFVDRAAWDVDKAIEIADKMENDND